MEMDTTTLMVELIAGLLGTAMIMYAKKSMRLVPLAAGLGLMIVPFFITNMAVLSLACVGFTCLPFLFPDA